MKDAGTRGAGRTAGPEDHREHRESSFKAAGRSRRGPPFVWVDSGEWDIALTACRNRWFNAAGTATSACIYSRGTGRTWLVRHPSAQEGTCIQGQSGSATSDLAPKHLIIP